MLISLQWHFIVTNHVSLLLIIANYTVLTVLSFIIFNKLTASFLKNLNINNNAIKTTTIFGILFFLNLAGLPPLPGFFIKLNLLNNLLLNINIYLIIIVLLINFTIFYFYIQFYKNIFAYTKVKNINISKAVLSVSTIIILCLVNFYPLYNLFILHIL